MGNGSVSNPSHKRVLLRRIAKFSFLSAYRFCRRAGERPWCSVRLALESRFVRA